MKKFTHDFINEYNGPGAFGFDRETDEETVMMYLQMFSDDSFLKVLLKRVSDENLDEIYTFINKYLRNHISESEYHNLFLKDGTHK